MGTMEKLVEAIKNFLYCWDNFYTESFEVEHSVRELKEALEEYDVGL